MGVGTRKECKKETKETKCGHDEWQNHIQTERVNNSG